MDRSALVAIPAVEDYSQQLREIEQQHRIDSAIDRRYGFVRVMLFIGFLLALLLSITTSTPVWTIVAAGCFVAFIVAITLNETIRDRLTADSNRKQTLRRLYARTQRDWTTLSSDAIGRRTSEIQLSTRQRSLSDDLDLVGDVSLFQLVSMAGTKPGARTLANWLCSPASIAEAQSRHAAAKHLAPRREDRIRFYTLSREVGSETGDPDRFATWATSPQWLADRRWLLPWANISLILAVALILIMLTARLWLPAIDAMADWQPRDVGRIAGFSLLLLAIINFTLTSLLLGPVAEIFSIAISSRRHVDQYAELFAAAQWLPSDSDGNPHPVAKTLIVGSSENPSASDGMKSLAVVAKLASLKQSAGTFLIYLPMQAFGLWDVRVLKRLEAWKDTHAGAVNDWFHSLGKLEALLSLAALCDESPRWTSPIWLNPNDAPENGSENGSSTLTMQSMGHPLLPEASRVTNDVTIGPRGTLLLVTGSNMSGKSTMLRGVGLNVSLAMAGGPVCCQRCEMPAVELSTSIRVSDDLGRGVSYYMAELNRLAEVVAHARDNANQSNAPEHRGTRPVLFLLDEILQGTNSRERQIAVSIVLRHLVDCGAIGAITTHDLELADDPELKSIAQTVHFRETIEPTADGNDRMTFDYKMRDGVSPTTNALRLLEMVGLGPKTDAKTARTPNPKR